MTATNVIAVIAVLQALVIAWKHYQAGRTGKALTAVIEGVEAAGDRETKRQITGAAAAHNVAIQLNDLVKKITEPGT